MRVLVVAFAVVLATLAVAGSSAGIAYWAMARRFVAADAHALDGIVRAPVNEPLAFRGVSLWDGRGGPAQRGRSVVVNNGRIVEILDAAAPLPAGVRAIDGSDKTLVPGLIDAHVHPMYDSGPDLLTRAPQLVNELAVVRQYPESRAPIVRRGQLKLKAGVTTMRAWNAACTRFLGRRSEILRLADSKYGTAIHSPVPATCRNGDRT